MTREELHKQLEDNRKEIKKLSNLIDNMHQQLKALLDKDTDLYYKILELESPAEYEDLVKGFRVTDVPD